MDHPAELRYSKDHVWVRVDGDAGVVIGITDFGQESMGEIAFVDLPSVDKEVVKDEVLIAVGSSKAFVDLPSPVSGKVLAINEAIMMEPVLVNNSPYGDGWLVKMRLSKASELEEMMDSATYTAFTPRGMS
jgi:glycine cleavage system H protein